MYRRSLAYLVSKKTYIKHASTIIFIVGFLFDMAILPDVDDPLTKYVGLTWLGLLAFSIMFREWIVSRNTASQTEQTLYTVSTFCISYFSGSALSFIFVYALRSAALSVSWPLFVIFLLCMVANEFVSTYNYRFTLDVAVFFIALLFYVVFNVPVLLKTQNNLIFLLSIGISVVISWLYVFFLSPVSDTARHEAHRGYALALGIPMFVGMLYFLQVLPAVPLSLKEAGVYHSVIRTEEGQYVTEAEIDDRFLAGLRRPVFHMTSTDTGLFFFSAVDAPELLKAPLSHVWQYYDEEKNKWVTQSTISFGLTGGRSDGFRAYSQKETIWEGKWRVIVKVADARIVGQTTFYVKKTEDIIQLQQVTF